MLPAVHVLQAVQLAALDIVLNVEPAIHAVQPRFVVVVQAVDTRLPAGHVLQVVQGAVPDVDVLYLPAAHVRHEEPEQYLPAGHDAQASCRAPETGVSTISVACIWISLPNAVGAAAVAINRSPANKIRERLTI